MREVAKGTTDESGVVVFAGLPLGPYYCQESQVPPGYFPEGGIELVYLDGNGKVVTLSYTNKPARGSIKLTKKNSDGELMSGVVFTLYDADKNEIKTGTTDANGVPNILAMPYIIEFECPFFSCRTLQFSPSSLLKKRAFF